MLIEKECYLNFCGAHNILEWKSKELLCALIHLYTIHAFVAVCIEHRHSHICTLEYGFVNTSIIIVSHTMLTNDCMPFNTPV